MPKKNKFVLPQEIHVGSIIYKIEEKENLTYDDHQSNERVYGLTCYDKQTIYIEKNLEDDVKKVVLLHEILHTLLFNGGEDDINTKIHRIIDLIAHQLMEFFIKNPDFYKHLQI